MAAIATTAAGSWAFNGTWVGGVVPAIGDTATINHNVYIPIGSTVIGVSPGANDAVAAVLIGSGGTLTIQDGATLYPRGDINNGNNGLVMDNGSTIEFDASHAGSPSTAIYRLLSGYKGSDNYLHINGTLAKPCEIRSNAGGANAKLVGTSNPSGGLTATYCKFTRMGDASNNSIYFILAETHKADLRNCIFDACGEFGSNGNHINDTAVFYMENCTFKNSVATTQNIYVGMYLSSPANGVARTVKGCVWDKNVKFAGLGKLTFDDNYLHQDFVFTNGDVGPTGPFKRNFIRVLTGDRNTCSEFQDNFILHDGSGVTNPHFITVGVSSDDIATETHSGNVFQFSGPDDAGDVFNMGFPSVAKLVIMDNNIFLRNSSRTGSCGTPFSALGNANITMKFRHNTFYTGGQGCAVGETYTGRPGLITEFYSNIGYDDAGTARGVLLQDTGTDDTVSDLVTSAHADYNCSYGLLPGSNLKGYHHLEFSSGAPGAHDLNVDPQFVNSNYLIEDWDTSLGGAGTISNALTELRKKNDYSGYNTAYSTTNLIAAVKAAMRPRNQALKNAGQDGVDMGAVPVAAPSGPPSGLSLLGVGF